MRLTIPAVANKASTKREEKMILHTRFDWTPLHWAVYMPNEPIVRLFFSRPDANTDMINLRDKDGETLLFLAAERGHTAILDILLEHGADVNARCKRGFTALSRAAQAGSREAVERLLAAGAQVNERDEAFGNTALHLAAMNGREEVVEVLLKQGGEVDAEARNGEGMTALDLALRRGHWGVVEMLKKDF